MLIFVSHKLSRGLSERPLSVKTGFLWQVSNSSPSFPLSLASMKGTHNEFSQLKPKQKQRCTGYSFFFIFPIFIPLHTCVLTAFSFLFHRRGGAFSLSTCTQPHNTAIPPPSLHVSICPTKYTLRGVAFKIYLKNSGPRNSTV